MRLETVSLCTLLLLVACRSASKPTVQANADAGRFVAPPLAPSTDTSGEGLAVIVSKTSLIVDDEVILPLPPRDEAAATGFGAKHKAAPSGQIVPLAAAIRKSREKALGRVRDEAFLIADPSTPYRLVTEILLTLGHQQIPKYHLMVIRSASDADAGGSRSADKLPSVAFRDGPPISLKIRLGEDGLLFDPGCRADRAPTMVPRIAGQHDLNGARRCAEELKKNAKQETAVTMGATGATPYGEIIEVLDAIRTNGNAELFPAVSFSPPE